MSDERISLVRRLDATAATHVFDKGQTQPDPKPTAGLLVAFKRWLKNLFD
jgi:hypothetical protein